MERASIVIGEIIRAIGAVESKFLRSPARIRLNRTQYEQLVEPDGHSIGADVRIAGIPIVPDDTIEGFTVEIHWASLP